MLKDAETELKEAQRIAEEIGEMPLLWQIHASLGSLYQTSVGAGFTPALSKAKQHFEEAKEIIEKIASTIRDGNSKRNFLNSKPVRSVYEKGAIPK